MSTKVHSTGPLTATPLILEIEKIRLYDKNPCREINPKYAGIKASIRAQRRLNDPLSITRCLSDDLYMVESGDNTRLKILKELWRETRDQSFHAIHCLFVPWISECRILSPHIVEKELRGDRTFIDKALRLINLKRQLEEEQGKTLSRSECQRRLSDIGCTVSRRQMIRLDYAAEFLAPLLPKALKGGLGAWQIDQIRHAEKAYREYCEALPGFTVPFDSLFCEVLAQHDSEQWDFSAVRGALDRWVADATLIPSNQIRSRVDAFICERAGARPDIEPETAPDTSLNKRGSLPMKIGQQIKTHSPSDERLPPPN